METAKVLESVNKILGGSVSAEIDINDANLKELVEDLHKAKTRLELSRNNIAVDFPQGGSTSLTVRRIGGAQPSVSKAASKASGKAPEAPASGKAPTDRSKHTYIVPAIAKDFMKVIGDSASHVVWLTGPTQCGKDRLVHYAGRELGRRVFQINCRGDMGSEIFFGDRTITIDPVTKQSIVTFQKGLVEQAMTEGLDENGKEVGSPGILFITEAASMPAHVAIGVNRLLESDDVRRTMVIDADGGRTVRSHSGFRMVFAANTVGRGATGMESAAYTAQTDALDISLLNRIAVCFRMGYDRRVEYRILLEKVGDDKVVSEIIKFRDAIRAHIKQGKLSSPFSTAHLIHISDMYRVFGDIGKAIYYVVFEFLMPEEKAIYNEQAVAVFGKDILGSFQARDIDYM